MITAQYAVTATTGEKFVSPGKVAATIYNQGPNSAFVGASGVADTDGFEIPNAATVTLNLKKGESVHAVCSTAQTASLSVAFTAR